MKALIVVALTGMIAAGLGRTAVGLILGRAGAGAVILRPVERLLAATALGLGAIGYGVYAIGLCGLLSPGWIAGLLAVYAAVGVPGFKLALGDLREMRAGRNPAEVNESPPFDRALSAVLICTLAALLLIGVAACYRPPGPHEWDALAYHLADPKLFLMQHRISILPTEHHSNFPFTIEMLFTIGLAFDGYAAANLFHLLTAVLLVIGIVSFADRFLTRRSGVISAVIFATTPIVLWEASIAYIDLALALYVFLAAYICLVAARQQIGSITADQTTTRADPLRLMAVAGAIMGIALGVKYLALVPLVLIAALALYRRVPIRAVALFIAVAGTVGSPWYIKNVVWMRNPVYPYAFNVFSGSRYWSSDRAAPYSDEQRSFGTEHSIGSPMVSLRNIAVTPWKLVANPELYTNKADFTFTSLIGGLYAGLLFALLLVRKPPGAIVDILCLLFAMFLAWFFISQHVRYLLTTLPFAAIACGFAVDASIRTYTRNRAKIVNISAAILAMGAVMGQAALLAWGILTLPTGGRAAEEAQERGVPPTALSVPEAVSEIAQPAERDRIMQRLANYGAAQWINAHTQAGAGVVLYEDVLGFYLDRPYLWGNGEHSSYIPYDGFRTGDDLSEWMVAHGIRYALFNLNNTPSNPHTAPLPDDPDVIAATLRYWYDGSGAGWRGSVGKAIMGGGWTLRYAHHGVAVLEIGTRQP